MAGKKEVEPLQRVTINLFASDYAVMQAVYNAIGAQVAIRRIIRAHVQKLNERVEEMDAAEEAANG